MNNEQQCREAFERELIKKYGLNEDQAKTFFNDMGYEYEIYQAGYNAKAQESQWVSVDSSKPSQSERVLLNVSGEDCLVVGYWGCGQWEACTVNHEVQCGTYCQGGNIEACFTSDEVTHWMPRPSPPKEQKEK